MNIRQCGLSLDVEMDKAIDTATDHCIQRERERYARCAPAGTFLNSMLLTTVHIRNRLVITYGSNREPTLTYLSTT